MSTIFTISNKRIPLLSLPDPWVNSAVLRVRGGRKGLFSVVHVGCRGIKVAEGTCVHDGLKPGIQKETRGPFRCLLGTCLPLFTRRNKPLTQNLCIFQTRNPFPLQLLIDPVI